MMSQRSSIVWSAVAVVAGAALLAAALAATALVAAPAPPPPVAAAAGSHRVELPAAFGQPFPYTVEIPADWQVLTPKDKPGLWLGPADGHPPDDPRLVYVRISRVPLADPAKIVATVKANAAADPSFKAPLAEVREVGGIQGVLIQVDSGAGDKARSSLTLKMPLAKTSVDFIGDAPAAEFARLRPLYERVLFSVRPAPGMNPSAPPLASKPPAKPPAGKP